MEKVKNGKNLKEKVLFLMCLGVLAGNMSAGVYAQDSEVNYDKYYKINGENEIIDEIIISDDGEKKEWGIFIDNESTSGTVSFKKNVEIKKNNFGSSVYVVAKENNGIAEFKKNLIITNKLGYALYANAKAYSNATATASIIINKNKKNTVQIIGNIKAESIATPDSSHKANADSKITLNLTSFDSFFAGKIEAVESKQYEGKTTLAVDINLEKGATWYAHNSNGIDSYNISGEIKDALNGNLKTLITSNGGVIDIYHTAPNESPLLPTSEQLGQIELLESQMEKELKKLGETYGKNSPKYKEAKKDLEMMFAIEKAGILGDAREKGERTFTLNGVGDRLQNTTFRISTDVENKKSDKIVLNDVKVNKDKEIYFIEIAADPFESGEWKADKDDKILVMDINGTGLDKITVEGKEYEAEIGAGLVKQTITPTVEEDSNNKGDWYLTAIEKVENTAGNKGSGHIFAEIGAAANAGMAAAWRADSSDIYQRMGNLRNNEAEQGVWGRIYTGENEVRKGIGLDLEYRAVQVGYDRKEKIDEGKLFTGIAFGYFDGNADYDHGSGESNSATVGLYATYLGANGSFGDFIIKYGNLDNELSYTSESGDSYRADYDTYGFSADAEYGYRYMFDNDYYIEPLAQLSYVYIDDEDYTMNLNGKSGARVSNDSYQSLIGYAGFHYGKKFDDNVAYLRVAAAHEFMGDIDINAKYQDIKVNSSISGEDTWVEYGVGFDAKVKEDTAVYGRLQRSTGDVIRNKWHVSLGIRYTF